MFSSISCKMSDLKFRFVRFEICELWKITEVTDRGCLHSDVPETVSEARVDWLTLPGLQTQRTSCHREEKHQVKLWLKPQTTKHHVVVLPIPVDVVSDSLAPRSSIDAQGRFWGRFRRAGGQRWEVPLPSPLLLTLPSKGGRWMLEGTLGFGDWVDGGCSWFCVHILLVPLSLADSRGL